MNYKENKKLILELIDCKRKGEILESKNYGKYKILGKTKKISKYLIEFLDTGFQTLVPANRFKDGLVKDLYKPTKELKGYNGRGPHKESENGKDTKEYILWISILKRCSILKEQYKNPKISEEWLCFQNFAEDIKKLENYKSWKNSTNYHLDKDILSKKERLYSKDTCLFVTQQENQDEKNLRIYGGNFLATRIEDGYEEKFSLKGKFAEKYNLSAPKIGLCLAGKRKKHKNWRFEELV